MLVYVCTRVYMYHYRPNQFNYISALFQLK